MTVKTLKVTGAASGQAESAAADPKDFVRKGEIDARLGPLEDASHAKLTITDTNSVDLVLPSGTQQLSANVRRKTTGMSVDQGTILETADGLVVALGLTTNTAAKGTDMAAALDAIAGKANASHSHAIADVTGLSDALAGKAASSHGHAIADVSGLSDALPAKTDASHSHAAATSSSAGFLSAADKQKLDAASDNTQWRPSVATINDLPLNIDPVGACRLVRDKGWIYKCVATVGFLSDQWKPQNGKYAQTFGDGSSLTYTINHKLQNEDVIVQVRKSTAPQDIVAPLGIRVVDLNNVLLSFSVAPASGTLRVTII